MADPQIVESALPPPEGEEGDWTVIESTELPEDATTNDPEAPYGRFNNGKPRKHPAGSKASGNTTVRLKVTEQELADKITEYIALPVAMVSPLASAVIDDRAERTAKALTTLAGNSPRFAKGLKLFMKGSAYGELFMLPVAVAIAGLVDFGRLAPNAMAAQRLGITTHYFELYGANTEAGMNGHSKVEPRSGFG